MSIEEVKKAIHEARTKGYVVTMHGADGDARIHEYEKVIEKMMENPEEVIKNAQKLRIDGKELFFHWKGYHLEFHSRPIALRISLSGTDIITNVRNSVVFEGPKIKSLRNKLLKAISNG